MKMTKTAETGNNIIVDCWNSMRSMPLWVQVWVFFILVPVNMVSMFFIAEPMGLWIAFLANIAMMMNLPVMIVDRGFSKAMALPHLVPWTILIALLLFARPEADGAYAVYLWALLIVDTISLMFDFPDALKWLRGDRARAGR